MASAPTLRPSVRDLWALAAAQLNDGDRSSINLNQPSKLNILSELLAVTEQAKQECIKKKWRYTRKSGETVIISDLFSKVIRWIDLFKQVGDAAVQYDPVHAALPWAGVRFLLQIAVNDIAKFAFVMEDITSIAQMICRYAVFEDVYAQSISAADDELERALIRFYAAILIYLSKARKYFQENSAKRIIKSGLLAKTDLESYFQNIIKTQETVDRCSDLVNMRFQIDAHEEMKCLLEQMDSPIQRLSDELRNIKDGLDTSKRTEILRWISSEPYLQHHEQTKMDLLLGTGQWLLTDPIFATWRKESVSSMLWLHGIPGSGKSKLTAIFIEDTIRAYKAGENPPPVFFYCSRNTAEPGRSNPEAIIASIARQLSSLEPGLPLLNPSIAVYLRKEAEGFASGTLRINESCALIIQLIEHYPLTTIVIDALDECNAEKRADLLEALETILRESTQMVKIFVSSRDDQDIVCHLNDYPNLEISSDRNLDDVVSFIRAETRSLITRRKLLRFSSNKDELEEVIIDQVTKGTAGMFRWASLQLQSLCDLKTDEAVRERLGRLPPKLEDLYVELHEKISKYPADADRRIARNVFVWLLCAQRRLNSAEFLSAVSICPASRFCQLSKDQVLDICCNLVVFDTTLDTFRFAHLSVREFLERQQEYDRTTINSLAAETCLLELIRDSPDPTVNMFLSQYGATLRRDVPSVSDFKTYPTIYWATHCQLAGPRRDKGSTSPLALWTARTQELFEYNKNVDYKLQEKLRDSIATSATAVFLACSFDFSEVITDQITKGSFRANYANSDGYTALLIAVKHGSRGVISVLLMNEHIQVTEEVVKTAAENSSSGKDVIKLLLDRRGDEVKITDKVVEAAARNYNGKDVLTFLLDRRGDEVKITDKITDKVVEAAARSYNGKDVLTLLLDRRGDEVNITDEVVQAAAGNEDGGIGVMKLLLDRRGDEVKITDEVVQAAAGNEDGVMKLLLDRRGDEVKITDKVVQAAAGNEYGGTGVMKLLLDRRGDEVKITDEVVKAAARNYNGKDVLTLLLDRCGDEVEITDEVVQAAAGNEGGGIGVMKLLLDRRGDEVKITDEVFRIAAHCGQGGALNLLERRFAVDIRYWVPIAQLCDASKVGDGKVVQRLLSLGVDYNSKDYYGRTPLWWSAAGGHAFVTLLFLGRDNTQPNEADIYGTTPLHVAAGNGHKTVVKLLLSQDDIEPDLADNRGRTALDWAEMRGFMDIALEDKLGRTWK
ncbi:hypothetical protein OIDMADRAFT_107066 [Oidiodendron maius Zn]|uniref:NWD NACHT-NTPase N-terminal domain-containing protein n=1 Tax=Oidiodendron maius (strain Zn) TaxID=913774 RepID=A0A0C3GMN3_OIDMZ|nr:hypothetical protein OIDMADRAFT_107066 [Oidiodendron maius Zn]